MSTLVGCPSTQPEKISDTEVFLMEGDGTLATWVMLKSHIFICITPFHVIDLYIILIHIRYMIIHLYYVMRDEVLPLIVHCLRKQHPYHFQVALSHCTNMTLNQQATD